MITSILYKTKKKALNFKFYFLSYLPEKTTIYFYNLFFILLKPKKIPLYLI